MKTNPLARGLLRFRVIVFCLAVVGVAWVGIGLGESLTVKRGPTVTRRTAGPPMPNAGLADALAAARY